MCKKLEIIHIHTDMKFIDDSTLDYEDLFNNRIILTGVDNSYNGKYVESIIFFDYSLKSVM